MKIYSRKKDSWSDDRAFSLVEVTIAMAIAAVALVSIIGLIPRGMQTMQEAGDRAIEARIHQQILGELQMAPFGEGGASALDTYNGLEIYYDAQGEEIGDSKTGSTAKGSFEHVFSARVTVPRSGGELPDSVGGEKFSGFRFAADGQTTELLRPVVVEIAAVGGRANVFDWDSDADFRFISTYQSYVVKMDK